MDIVTRLKTFMSALNIANSQFADTCRIPRPTISQILNGRNKKISDELIGKIHDAYPQLSVLWLMFGEGDMFVDANIQISEPKKGDNIDFDSSNSSVDEDVMGRLDFEIPITESTSDKFKAKNQQRNIKNVEYKEDQSMISASKVVDKPALSINTSPTKQVIEIRVFYNDNSYEIFVPQKNNI